jgi:hypothetical protein
MKDTWHVLELFVAIALTVVALAWLIAFAAVWIMQG